MDLSICRFSIKSKFTLSLTNIFFSCIVKFLRFLLKDVLMNTTYKAVEILVIFENISKFCSLGVNTGTYVLDCKFSYKHFRSEEMNFL